MPAGDKGFTLVEVMITVVILTLVLTGTYTFLHFESDVYNQGINKAELQSSLRLVTDMIVREIRYAESVELLGDYADIPSDPGDVAENTCYVYWDQAVAGIYLLNDQEKKLLSSVAITDFQLHMEGQLLNVVITGTEGDESLAFETSVLMLNEHSPAQAETTVPAVRYRLD